MAEMVKMTAKQVADRVKQVYEIQNKHLDDAHYKEFHQRIYDDGIWTIDLEVFAVSKQVRFWVAREDKLGHYNNSLVTMYRDSLGDFRYSCNFKLKYDIVRRLKMIFEQLEKLR